MKDISIMAYSDNLYCDCLTSAPERIQYYLRFKELYTDRGKFTLRPPTQSADDKWRKG